MENPFNFWSSICFLFLWHRPKSHLEWVVDFDNVKFLSDKGQSEDFDLAKNFGLSTLFDKIEEKREIIDMLKQQDSSNMVKKDINKSNSLYLEENIEDEIKVYEETDIVEKDTNKCDSLCSEEKVEKETKVKKNICTSVESIVCVIESLELVHQ